MTQPTKKKKKRSAKPKIEEDAVCHKQRTCKD